MIRSPSVPFIVAGLVLCTSLQAQERPLIDCDCPMVRLDDAWCASAMVFEGVPYATDTTFVKADAGKYAENNIRRVRVRCIVENVLKGPDAGPVNVFTDVGEHDECAFRFITGEHYLIFAREEDDLLVIDHCTPTRAMDTVSKGFRDSLEYVRGGHQWEGHVPLSEPCQ